MLQDTPSENLEELFKELYLDYFTKIKFYAFSYLCSEELAMGVAQETFLVIWEKMLGGWYQRDALPLLYVIAKHKCCNILRKKVRNGNFINEQSNIYKDELAYIAVNHKSSESIYGKEALRLYNIALNSMPKDIKDTFLYSRNDKLKYREIAEKMNISSKTVEYRISCAFKILRHYLKDYLTVFICIKLFNL